MTDLFQTNNETIEVLVELLDEGTETWRPAAVIESGNELFRLLPTSDYDPEDEIWAFEPGSLVRLEEKILGDGKKHLVATHPDKNAKRIHVESDQGLQTTYALEVEQGFYRVLENRSASGVSGWRFPPGSMVTLTTKKLPGGKFTLAAPVQ